MSEPLQWVLRYAERGWRVFPVRGIDDRRQYADNPMLAIGRVLTVKYQGLTALGMPRFPVVLRFREDV